MGAEIASDGTVHFRVWAPKSARVIVEFGNTPATTTEQFELAQEGNGYYSGELRGWKLPFLYRLRLADGAFPDPASRFQPEGPHGPSAAVDPRAFRWTDQQWQGVRAEAQIIYEMHIGTFTREGNWKAAAEQLQELARLGVTIVELMPVADFPGRFGWGYDGVALFAPTRLYGSPDDFRAFVDAAHCSGLGVMLDVVYNHLGPDGNYLDHFSDDYFTDRYQCEWGRALNFDGEHSGPVREFFCANAAYWIEEFHLDGLRLDATQQIFDATANHVLTEISRAARAAAGKRRLLLTAENEPQQSKLIRPIEQGGYGLDALWNDDLHHTAMVALTGKTEAYYRDYRGTPQEFISVAKRGFLYQGQWYSWQSKTRGSSTAGLRPSQFVNFLQNHDQVANSPAGARLDKLCSPGCLRALTAWLILSPGTPMLFQGQEFWASAPFLYFADHNTELGPLVAKGRRDFLRQFQSRAGASGDAGCFDPAAPDTFSRSKLDLAERARHSGIYQFHRDLLALRRQDAVLSQPQTPVDGAVLSSNAFMLRFFGNEGDDRLLMVNLGTDLLLSPAPEPLLAASDGGHWTLKWSTEETRYGGAGVAAPNCEQDWRLPGQSALLLAAAPRQ